LDRGTPARRDRAETDTAGPPGRGSGTPGPASVAPIATDAGRNAGEATRVRERDFQRLADIVSHELRSPLNGILSWAYVLENHLADGTPATKRALAGIRNGVDQQVRLIEDLLDATRVMSGNLGLAKSPMAVRPVVEAAIEGLRAVAAQKGIEIVSGIALGDEQVDGDPDRIQQIVRNLLQSALKFTRTTVWVTAAVQETMISITVQDDGVGIAPEFLPFLFDPFCQAAGQANIRRQEGLGLGLTLVQRVAELHGGHVVAESLGEDTGATFRVFLPRRSRRWN
jgi:signal transduction histidine kinase